MSNLFAMIFEQSQAWFRRAAAVIPGGIYGHAAPAVTVPGAVPYYAARGEGCRYWDVDGNEFIDLMCGYGPLVLGYHHAEVEAAVGAARARGACFNHPTALMVELAERLTERIDFAEWAVFAKNGSDLTTWAVRVAREVTGRSRILKVRGAYHGAHAWCSPGVGGLIAEDRAQVGEFGWNEVEELERWFAGGGGAEVAAVVVTPFHHPAYADSELPTAAFVAVVNEVCRRHGALLVLDDVRCGFRLSSGGSHGVYGFEPDLAVYCKAMGNGHPISACVGKGVHKVAASRVFLTGSYWNDPAPMAAALTVLEVVARDGVPAQLEQRGRRLVDGLLELGRKYGVGLKESGPVAMPYVRVAEDPAFMRTQRWAGLAAERGVFLHPHHNWFLGAAHGEADIDEALTRLGASLAALAEEECGGG